MRSLRARIFDRISIHAPARGATSFSETSVSCSCYFNPRSRKGSDAVSDAQSSDVQLFQSTLPQGERQQLETGLSYSSYFNPRSRKGSDDDGINYVIINGISIHAPARGATVQTNLYGQVAYISIHAPARGATTLSHSKKSRINYFNPRSRKGSDDCYIAICVV